MFSRKQRGVQSKPQVKSQALQLGDGGTLLNYAVVTDPSPLPLDAGVGQTIVVMCRPGGTSTVFLEELIITLPIGSGPEDLCVKASASGAKLGFNNSSDPSAWSYESRFSIDGTQWILDITPLKEDYIQIEAKKLLVVNISTTISNTGVLGALVNMNFEETAASPDPSNPSNPGTFVTGNWSTGLSKGGDGYNLHGFQVCRLLPDAYEAVSVVDPKNPVFVRWITDPTINGLDLNLSYGETTVSVNDFHTSTSYQYPPAQRPGISLDGDTIFQLTASYTDITNKKQTISYQWQVMVVAPPWILPGWSTIPSLTKGTTTMSVMKWDPITINWNINDYVQFCEIVITDDESTTTIGKNQLGSGPPFSYTIPGLSKDSQVTVWAYGSSSANQPVLTDYRQFTAKVFDYVLQNQPIAVGTGPIGIAVSPPNGSMVWTANFVSNDVSSIVTSSKTVSSYPIGVGAGPAGIAISLDGSSVWVANSKSNTVSVIDVAPTMLASSLKTVGSPIGVGVGPWGIAISPDGSSAWVTNSDSGTVSVISASSQKTVGNPIVVGNIPKGIAISPDGSSVWVANAGSNTVSVISASSQKTVGSPIVVGIRPWGMVISPDGSNAWVTNAGSGTVSVISVSSQKTVGSPIVVGDSPDGIAISSDSRAVLVANAGSGTISVISASSQTLVSTIVVGDQPQGIAISPYDSSIWVAKAVMTPGAPNVSLIQKLPIGSGSNALAAPALRRTVGNALAAPAPRTSTQLRGLRLGLETLLQTMAATVPFRAQQMQYLDQLKTRLQPNVPSQALVPASNKATSATIPIVPNLPAYNPAFGSCHCGNGQGCEHLVAQKASCQTNSTAAGADGSLSAAPLPRHRKFK